MQLILSRKTYCSNIFREKFSKPWIKMERYIYTLPRRVTINTNLRIFQYKVLHNILYLNKMLYKFGKKVSPLCSFCFLFWFLNKNKFSLDAATTSFPKCINNPSNYTTDLHLWTHWSQTKVPLDKSYTTYIYALCL